MSSMRSFVILFSAIVWLSTKSHAFVSRVSNSGQEVDRMVMRRSHGTKYEYLYQPFHWRPVLRAKAEMELDNEEPLSLMFQRAVVLQRAGSHSEALDEYNMFLKAAVQCQVDPSMYAEVYGNMGALYLRQQDFAKARGHLQQALTYRPKFGTAHVNLAVVALQEASSLTDATLARKLMDEAKQHCTTALTCNTDPRSVAMARRLLDDIQNMLTQPFS